ncbi:MAG TPA: hypothetical protein VMS89_00240 [Methanoregulaceae archaeon]|nr:hypothetical protein [Methanoregulaceae archaeon]
MSFADTIRFMPKLMGRFSITVILPIAGHSSLDTANRRIDGIYPGAMKSGFAWGEM